MNRTYLILNSYVVAIFLTIVFGVVFVNGNVLSVKSNEKDDVIVCKETALKVGRALLEEHFPEAFSENDVILDAEEKDGVWRVYNVLQRQSIIDNGNIQILVGGEFYVEFYKSNGKVVNIGIND